MKRTLIFGAAALCGFALACSESELVSPDVESDTPFAYGAKGGKPGGGGGGDEPTPPGTIYATIEGTTYTMDGDGQNRVPLGTEISGVASHFLDAGVRWFLSYRLVGTGCDRYNPSADQSCYPDSTSMTELVLMGSNGTESTLLLPDPFLAPGAARWAPDDARISFYGRRFPDAHSEASEGGIYVADIDLTGLTLSNITLVAPTSMWSPNDPVYPNSGCLTNGICPRYPRLGRGGHDWSPSGDRIAYSVCGNFETNDDSTYVVNVSSGSSELLLPWGVGPAWSTGNQLLLLDNQHYCFWVGNNKFFVVNADGSSPKMIQKVQYNFPKVVQYVSDWNWSPTGEHFVYFSYDCRDWSRCTFEMIRSRPDGSYKKVLDTAGWDVLGWR